jgi:outer membrane protein TolC
MQDRKRQLQEAELALLNARLDLAVLIFPDFNDKFELKDDLHATIPIPTLDEVQRQAAIDNPDLGAALAAVQEAGHGVVAARAAYLPPLTLDYFYGIDATHFAVNSVVDGHKFSNLGTSIEGSLNLPIWNWGATQSRVKQAELRRTQAKRELSLAQRKHLADLQSIYSEVDTALGELNGLRRSGELAGESLRLTTLRYENGEAKVLDVVDGSGDVFFRKLCLQGWRRALLGGACEFANSYGSIEDPIRTLDG